jgi:RNA polymerase sigma-70 factor (ECF subfamily)
VVTETFRHEVGVFGHASFVRSELRRLGVSASELDDLVQEVWLVGLARSRSFADRAAARAWLGKVCRQVADMERQSRGRTRLLSDGAEPELPVEPQQDAHVEGDFDERKSVAALECLSAKQLDVLALYGSGELTMREVAALVGEPEKTVYSRYRSAIEDVTRELRRSDAVGLRYSDARGRRTLSAGRPISLADEHAADLGECVLYVADSELALGRAGNAVIAHWRGRLHEHSCDLVGATLMATHTRVQMPLVLFNLAAPDVALPNAKERAALFRNIRATRQYVGAVIDVTNFRQNNARMLRSILNGMLLATRSFFHLSFAMVDTLEEARSATEPCLRTVRGPMAWENVVRAIQLVSETS